MQTFELQPFADDFVFLEGPRWHDDRLWVSDIWDHTVYALDQDGRREVIARVPNRPSGLGFLPDGTPLVVSMTDRKLFRIEAGALVEHADLASLVEAEINDMVVDDQGRAYVGDMGYDLFSGAPERPGGIALVEPDGRCTSVAGGLDFPNGMALADGGRTLLVAESFGHRVSAFTRLDDGSLGDKRVYSDLPDLIPDGVCLDVEGGLWVAGAMGGAFVRLDAHGLVTARIDVAPRAAIACQLGGDDGRTLFCLIYDGGIEELSRGQPGASIATAAVDVPGAGSP